MSTYMENPWKTHPFADDFPEGAPMDFQMYVRSQVGPWIAQFYRHLIMLGNYSWEICGNTNENCDIYHNTMEILGNTWLVVWNHGIL